jgi:glycosyltransferase involved in cell wall biosynthesis
VPYAPGAMALQTQARHRLTPTDPDPLVTFVVPAYNEAASLGEVLRRVYALPLRAEVIAVDDGSTDHTSSARSAARRG